MYYRLVQSFMVINFASHQKLIAYTPVSVLTSLVTFHCALTIDYSCTYRAFVLVRGLYTGIQVAHSFLILKVSSWILLYYVVPVNCILDCIQ